MTFRGYLSLLRARWLTVVAATLVGAAAAGADIFLMTPQYEARTESFIALKQGANESNTAYQGGLFSQDRIKSYAEVVTSPAVTATVVERLKLPLTPDQLAGKIRAVPKSDTVLISITVRDPSAIHARDLANAVSRRFAEVVADLEAPSGTGGSLVKVSVIRSAAVPQSPVSPRIPLTIALGVVTGLLLGVGLAVALDAFDTTIKSTADLLGASGIPNLGDIGFDREAPDAPLVVASQPGAPRAEAYRSLRTNLRFIEVDVPPRVVVVTSSVAGEGKSTTACNLAITLAHSGEHVVLVEGDLRRPRIGDYLGLESAVGLTDVLARRSPLDDVLQSWGGTTLSVLASGQLPPNPSELLGSAQMAELLAELRNRADYVIVDAPPLLPVTDAAVLAHGCDGAILVVRYGRTNRDQLRRAVSTLSTVGARALGTVMSMSPAPDAKAYAYLGNYAVTTSPMMDGLDIIDEATESRSWNRRRKHAETATSRSDR